MSTPSELSIILYNVCKASGVSIDEIKSNVRDRKIVTARQVYCYFAYKTGYTLKEIGKVVGIHHSTVIHSVHNIEDKLFVDDKRITKLVNDIKTII